MKKFGTLFVLLIVGFIGIVACAPTAAPTPVPTSTSAPTAVAIATETATATDTPEPTATWTLTATNTATATITPTATRTLTPSVTPTTLGEIELVDLRERFPGSAAFRSEYLNNFACWEHQFRTVTFDGAPHGYCLYSTFTRFPYYLFELDGVSLLTMPNPAQLLDESGEALRIAQSRQGAVFYWKRKDNSLVVMPFVFPRIVNGVEIIPVMKWAGGADKHVITGWQIWLLDKKTLKPIRKLQTPFTSLRANERVAWNDEAGYLDVVRVIGDSLVSNGHFLGLQLAKRTLPMGSAEGMRVFKFPLDDIGRFKAVLDWIKATTPAWRDFILSYRPIDIYYEPSLGARGWAGSAGCCSQTMFSNSIGQISFAGRPPENPSSDLWFMVTFVHEAAHVRDLRQGNFDALEGVEACRAIERSAVEMQRAYLGDLVLSPLIDEATRHTADQFAKGSDEILARGTFDWNPACVEK